MSHHTKKRFLLSPLNWGLGHATRIASVAEHLLSMGHEVIFAADGRSYDFLQMHFPDHNLVRIPQKEIRYTRSKKGFLIFLLKQIPGFLKSNRRGKPLIDAIVKEFNIDYIISENRYGFNHPDLPSAIITHQLRPIPPKGFIWLQTLLGLFHLWMLRKYDYIWVPDYEAPGNICGRLSTIPWQNKHIRKIGPISWLEKRENEKPVDLPQLDFDLLIMLSGLEPHRGLLEETISKELSKSSNINALILQGLPGPLQIKVIPTKNGSIVLSNHLPGSQIKYLIESVPKIICRAGTSTIMDLILLHKTALLIPTPGQTEQEYIAERLASKKQFSTVNQTDIMLQDMLNFQPAQNKLVPARNTDFLNQAIQELLQQVQNPIDASPDQLV